MIAVAGCLAIAAGAAHFTDSYVPLLLLAAAMGAENGVFLRDREVSIGVTYMTGTLVRVGQKLAEATDIFLSQLTSRQMDRLSRALQARGEGFYRSEEHTSELQSLMRISYAVFCLKKKKQHTETN